MGIWLAISCFASIGFEHCIANQFLITLGLWRGAHGTAYDYAIGNLLPSTIGNFIGGAICIATPYAFIYGTPSRTLHVAYKRKMHRFQAWVRSQAKRAGFSKWTC